MRPNVVIVEYYGLVSCRIFLKIFSYSFIVAIPWWFDQTLEVHDISPSFDPTKCRALLGIYFRRWCPRLSIILYMRPLTFWVLILTPFYISGYDSMQNVFLLLDISRFQLVWNLISLLLDVSRGLKSFRNSLLSNFQIFWELFCVRNAFELYFWKRAQLNLYTQ